MQEIKPKVKKVIDNWYNNTEYDIVHFWEQDDTWFVVIKLTKNDEMTTYIDDSVKNEVIKSIQFDFVRIFHSYRIKGEYHLSVDKKVDI